MVLTEVVDEAEDEFGFARARHAFDKAQRITRHCL